MKRQLKKLPESITPERAEEIFSDRLAELLVMTLDYQYEQKLKSQDTLEEKLQGEEKS